VLEKVKGKMENIGGEAEPIALCDSLLWMMIVTRVVWSLAASLF
jgi:hypothetical protein